MNGLRSLILGVLATLVFATGAEAQQTTPEEHSMTGCLQKGPGSTYMLTNVEGKGPQTVSIVSSRADLAAHVGHKIEVTGTTVPAKEAEAEKATKAPYYMRVSEIKMISSSCP